MQWFLFLRFLRCSMWFWLGRWLCGILLVSAVLSGGGLDEPACRAAGHAPLQPAMEDSMQAHEHRAEGNNNLASLLFIVACCECICLIFVSFARLSRILMRCTPSSPCSLIRWVTSGFASCMLTLGMLASAMYLCLCWIYRSKMRIHLQQWRMRRQRRRWCLMRHQPQMRDLASIPFARHWLPQTQARMVVSQCCAGTQMSASHHWLVPRNLWLMLLLV